MAPEMLRQAQYSEAADVYSFAVVVWETLARECPFNGLSQIQVALAVLNTDARPIVPHWCPGALRTLIESCWETDPQLRPSFAVALEALRDAARSDMAGTC